MKNIKTWKDSKFVTNEDGALYPSKNPNEVRYGSWLMCQYVANFYNEMIPKYCKGVLCDLGCGKVPLYGFYKQFVSENICVDWANSNQVNPNLDYELDLNNPLPFEDEAFDTILCSDVLEHLYNPVSAINEMVRITRRGGIIMINTPFSYWIHAEPYDYYRYTKYFFRHYAEEMRSVELLEIREFGSAIDVISDIIGKIFGNHFKKITLCFQKRSFHKYIKRGKKSSTWTLGYGVVLRKL